MYVAHLRQTESAVLLRDLDAEGAHVAQLLHNGLRYLPGAIDFLRINALHEGAQLVHEWLGACFFRRVGRRVRMNEVEAESAEEELAHEARIFPLGLARGLSNVARLLLAYRSCCINSGVTHVRLIKITSPIIEIAANENHWIA